MLFQLIGNLAIFILERRDRMDIPNNNEHLEGPVAKAIEEQTAKLPSDFFLWAALGSMGISLLLHFTGREHKSLFIGQWAAPFLILGLYNKIVKIQGHD